jgi:PHD/YefM family antitoxin component YafN of YafNO toxin-antitoxin module
MAKRVAAVRARQTLGTILDDVRLTGAEYVIERDGRPMAAIIPLSTYERYLRERDDASDRIESLRRRLADAVPVEELEATIAKAARERRD